MTLAAVEGAALAPTTENLERVLTDALGEMVSVRVAMLQTTELTLTTFGASTSFSPALSRVANSGRFRAGVHTVQVLNYDGDGTVDAQKTSGTVTCQANDAIVVPVVARGGFEYQLVYLSVSAGSTLTQIVKREHDGTPLVLTDYPSNPALPGLRHYWVVMSAESLASASQKAKADRILGPTLGADCTYTLVDTNSPFLLDTTSPPGSPLGTGAL